MVYGTSCQGVGNLLQRDLAQQHPKCFLHALLERGENTDSPRNLVGGSAVTQD